MAYLGCMKRLKIRKWARGRNIHEMVGKKVVQSGGEGDRGDSERGKGPCKTIIKSRWFGFAENG